MMTVDQAINLGLQYHQSGQLAAAVDIYGQILAAVPGHADALYLLGVATAGLGDRERAVGLIREAIQADNTKFQFYAALAHLLHDLDRPGEAETTACRALALQPGAVELYLLIGQTRAKLGDSDGAAAAYRMSVIIVPEYAPGYLGLGIVATTAGDLDRALRLFTTAVRLDPAAVEAQFDLAKALRDSGQLGRALERYRIVLTLAPDYIGAVINFGEALHANGDFPAAAAMFHHAIHLAPSNSLAYSNLALALHAQGALEAALAAHREAVRLDPDNADARGNMALTLLKSGQFAEGWEHYESRFSATDGIPLPPYHQPLWDGRPLNGATILLHTEQGLGDSLQFVRYAALVAERGGRVVLTSPPELSRLLATVPGVAEVRNIGETLPDFACHCPLMSLPRLFGTDLASIPAVMPYVTAAPAAVTFWRHRLAALPGLKVGLVWAGRPRRTLLSAYDIDRRRSIPLTRLVPLAAIPGVQLISLQKGDAADQIHQLPDGLTVTDWTASLFDFADTAALIEALDLIISVDTAVAHLAGALNKPVWVLSRFDGCWRWLTDRDDSPWYPSLRLFHQPQSGDWIPVVAAVTDALTAWSMRQTDRGMTPLAPTSLSL